MPVKPKRPCSHPGCRELLHGRYCAAHTITHTASQKAHARRYDKERGTAAERGYGSRWTEYSKRYRREHPLCVMCEAEGKLKTAQCVDHIEAVNGPDDPKFWDPDNHQSLCTSHHSSKTARVDGALGNHRSR